MPTFEFFGQWTLNYFPDPFKRPQEKTQTTGEKKTKLHGGHIYTSSVSESHILGIYILGIERVMLMMDVDSADNVALDLS